MHKAGYNHSISRGVCPSCNTRRMVETAAHLTDHVFPHLAVRQRVLSVPERLLRYCARPPFAMERLHIEGAALVPPPRIHRHRYFGVLAPNSPLRAAAVSMAAPAQIEPVTTGEGVPGVVPLGNW